jgi:hypothetical protein
LLRKTNTYHAVTTLRYAMLGWLNHVGCGDNDCDAHAKYHAETTDNWCLCVWAATVVVDVSGFGLVAAFSSGWSILLHYKTRLEQFAVPAALEFAFPKTPDNYNFASCQSGRSDVSIVVTRRYG